MYCSNCNTDMAHLSTRTGTKPRKFCSRSCAATYNNTRFPKRQAVDPQRCIDCSMKIPRRNLRCSECKILLKESSQHLTLKELRQKYDINQYHARIRGLARKTYRDSGRPLSCVCGYDLHVDICHRRDVKDFPDSTTISEVNHIDNLVALDKRCHWEFDNGYLQL